MYVMNGVKFLGEGMGEIVYSVLMMGREHGDGE